MSKDSAKKEVERRADILLGAICYLEGIPDDELQDMLSYCYSLNTTNCGWNSFRLAPLLIREIRSVMDSRKAQAEDSPATTSEKS